MVGFRIRFNERLIAREFEYYPMRDLRIEETLDGNIRVEKRTTMLEHIYLIEAEDGVIDATDWGYENAQCIRDMLQGSRFKVLMPPEPEPSPSIFERVKAKWRDVKE